MFFNYNTYAAIFVRIIIAAVNTSFCNLKPTKKKADTKIPISFMLKGKMYSVPF